MAKRVSREPGPLGRWMDSVALSLFPRWGARRIAYRRMFAAAEQKFASFDLASRTDPNWGQTWMTSRLSPDSMFAEDLQTARERSNDLFRNETWYTGATMLLVSNIVGCGIWPQAAIQPADGFLSESEADALNQELEKLFYRCAPMLGVDGLSLWEIQELVTYGWLLDGDGLVVMSDHPSIDKPIPLALEVIDAVRLESPAGTDRKNIRLGIERDQHKRRVAYWIRRSHPGDTIDTAPEHDRIDASRVCHLYQPFKGSQSRGMPFCFASGKTIKSWGEFADAHLMQQQAAACYVAFVESDGNPFDNAVGAASETASNGKRLQDLEPGRVHYLRAGEKVQFGDPNRPGNTFGPYAEAMLRSIAAGLNVSFEEVTRDYSKVNYSSGRLSLIQGRASHRGRQRRLIERVLVPIWKRFLREAVITGAIDLDASFYLDHLDKLEAHEWIAPGWDWIDPTKEVQADVLAIENNLKTKKEVLASRGKVLENVLRQRAKEKAGEEELDVIPPATPGSPDSKTAAQPKEEPVDAPAATIAEEEEV